MTTLSLEEKASLLALAKQSLEAAVTGRPMADYVPEFESFEEVCGAFVTLNKHGNLRGCIGNMQGHEALFKTIQHMAVEAGLRDPRFPAVEASELADIEIEISVLSPMKKMTDPSEIVVGKHGLMVVAQGRSGVLLPQVGAEYGWSALEFLGQTCHKAGLDVGAWRAGDVFLYTASVF